VAIRRLRLSLVLIALVAPAGVECQTPAVERQASSVWRFVSPNAKAVISISWQHIRQSAAGAIIRDKWLSSASATPGIELLDDIDRVVISSSGVQTPGGVQTAGLHPLDNAGQERGEDATAEPAELPLLIAVEGHFDAVKVHRIFARLGARRQAYNSFQVYRPQSTQTKDMAYVLFDATTILMGDAPSVFAALDRSQFAPRTPEPGSILARASDMDAAYEFWLVMNTPDVLSSGRLADLLDGAAPDAKGFEVGVSLRSGLVADITVRFASDAAAKQVVTDMLRLTAAAAKDAKTDAQLREISRKLKFSADGLSAKINLRLTPREFEKSSQAFATAIPRLAGPTGDFPVPGAASATTAGQAIPAQGLAQSAPATPGVIRIEGLDEGPREIPYPVSAGH